MKQQSQPDGPWTGNEGFSHVPTAPGMKEDEEGKLSVHFYVISPQIAPEAQQMNMLDTCQCRSSRYGKGMCGYHANKTRRFKQRLSYISRTSRPHANRMYQVSSVGEPLTLSSVFGGLAGCFGIPLGGMVWLAWFWPLPIPGAKSWNRKQDSWATPALTDISRSDF